MSNLKLGVEVVSVHNLMPEDAQGSANAFVELHFDNQRFRTTTKEKDLNLVWNESFYFNISDPNNLPNLTLKAYLYNHGKENNSETFLGKVRLTGTSFVAHSDAIVLLYPLEKQPNLSHVKGELGLKVFVTDNPEIRSSNPLPAMDSSLDTDSHSSQASVVEQQIQNLIPELFTDESETRHQFNHLPNVSQPQPQPQQQQQQQHFPPTVARETMSYETNEMRSSPLGLEIVPMYSDSSSQPDDYALKETSPFLGGGQIIIRGDMSLSTCDLVEQMRYLYVRVVKARDLPSKDVMGSCDPFVEVRAGNYKGVTKYFENQRNPKWNEVFAFARERMQSSVLEVVLKDKDLVKDDFVGIVRFDMNEIPSRVPPDSSLAPEWYSLEDRKGQKVNGELMLAVWYGTQADEAFPDAWHSDDVSPSNRPSIISTHIHSKVYHSPRLWYLRVNVVEAQNLITHEQNRLPDAYVKVQIGNQVLKTKMVQTRTKNPVWNEDLMFVVAEPFEDVLILSVEDRVGPNKDESIGEVAIPLNSVQRRVDDQMIHSWWFNLEKSISAAMDENHLKKDRFSSRVHLRIALDEGYHVFDESTHYSSDLRPTTEQLWKPSIGLLELAILNVDKLLPMKVIDGKGTSDTYCVAKYGHKWMRTRTIMNSLSPKFNDQYNWEVYDPATVVTVGVFDNNHIGGSIGNKEGIIGKVRIRLSTLENGRVYTDSYPLLHLLPSGVKKMGDLHLVIRFSYTSLANMMFLYTRPLLPKMHYVRPLNVTQQNMLRHEAVNIVAARLSQVEPPLCKEIVEYMSDTDSHQWSMRQTKANIFRIISVFSGLFAVGKWFQGVCMWKNPITTVLVHLLCVMLMCFPWLILPTVFLYMFLRGLWNYRFRPRSPPHIDTKISCPEPAELDELDEEFDTYPSTKHSEIVRMRYDRLRGIAGKIQTVLGDVATQAERIQGLLSWRDHRATAIFVMLCLLAAIVLYSTPLQYLALGAGFYWMRHPRLRHHTTSTLLNFLRRLPSRNDSML